MDKKLYNSPDFWTGAFYELSIEYHPFGNDNRINEALNALVESSFFNGMREEKKDHQKQAIILPLTIEEESVTSFYGTLSLSNSNQDQLPCMVSVIRVNGESDWVDLSIPESAFERVFPYKSPLTNELNPWLSNINEVYAQLAEVVYHHSPFDFAMIGEEISGETNQEEITPELMRNMICILPRPLLERLGLEGEGKELSNRLTIFG